VLVPEGTTVPVGTPIAIFCLEEEDIATVDAHVDAQGIPISLDTVLPFIWQAYLKKGALHEAPRQCGGTYKVPT
jgi:pyruvate/2-oxoglutarate dehydrogenase complex dihydrolipoamide acyltransferase (E2) component